MKSSILAFVILFLYSSPFFAQGFIIKQFHSDIRLTEQGTAHIQETIDVYFTERKRGIYRSIPTKYRFEDEAINLVVRGIKVDGHKSKIRTDNGQKIIRIGDPDKYLSGSVSYTISYIIEDIVQDMESWQELPLDINGTNWNAEIEKLSFSVNLPSILTMSQNDLQFSTGFDGESEAHAVFYQSSPKILKGHTTKSLQKGENLTIAMRYPPGYFDLSAQKQRTQERIDRALKNEKRKLKNQNPWTAAIPLGLFSILFGLWTKMRSKDKRLINDHYSPYPPEGLTSAHVGGYIDHQVNTRDILSLIPYWGTEGLITLQNHEGKVYLNKLKDIPSSHPSYEIEFFNALFENSNSLFLDNLPNSAYSFMTKAKSAVKREIDLQGYFDETYLKWFRSWRWYSLCIALMVSGTLLLVMTLYSLMGILTITAGFLLLLLSIFCPILSSHGSEVMTWLEGLESFLKDAPMEEIDDILIKDPAYFEKMLPFAVAFGIEKQWVAKFENNIEASPMWYIDQHNSPMAFRSFQSGFEIEKISSSFTPQYNNSSSSSFGGGGSVSSGGGFGGGGGGSW